MQIIRKTHFRRVHREAVGIARLIVREGGAAIAFTLADLLKYHGPLLQFHGDADSIVPYSLGEKLFAAANEPKQFVRVEGADHNDPRTNVLFERIDAFFDQLQSM